jgi:hypothetical protein
MSSTILDVKSEARSPGFTGERPLEDALGAYERTRNDETRGLYGLTQEFAALTPRASEQQGLFGRLRTNPDDTNRFFGVVAGTVRPDEFFAPDNLARIVGAPLPA